MRSELGLLGVFLFAIGGTLLFHEVYLVGQMHDEMILMLYFIGFLLLGLGLWVIVLCGKPDAKQTPSQNIPPSP